MFSIHPEIEGLTLFAAEPGAHVHDIHSHGAHSVIVVTSGAKLFHHEGRTVRIPAGSIAVSNPGDLHGCEPADGQDWSHQTWYLEPALLQEIAESLGRSGTAKLRSPVISDTELANRLNAAHAMAREGDVFERQSAALDALQALVELYGVGAETAPETEAASKAERRMEIYKRLLSDAGSEITSLSDLAAPADVSRNQVIRDFKQVSGVTPGVYRRNLQLELAKEALRAGRPLAQVAAEAGFSDQSHFSRMFRRAFGVTPNQYREVVEASDAPVSV